MSTAILISGQMRTFAQCYPSQRWHVLRHFPDCHFFIVVQKNAEAMPAIEQLIRDHGADHVHYNLLEDPKLEVTPEMSVAYDHAPYANAAPPHQLLLQHWYQQQVWEFYAAHQYYHSYSFHTIIRLRPDQFFHSFIPDAQMLRSSDHPTIRPSDCFTPWWGRFGGINDRLAILGPVAAKAYFTVYEKIPELLAEYHCPFHPESLVKAALEVAGCQVHETLRTEFTTLRANGQHRPPEIMPWDLAHAALHR